MDTLLLGRRGIRSLGSLVLVLIAVICKRLSPQVMVEGTNVYERRSDNDAGAEVFTYEECPAWYA